MIAATLLASTALLVALGCLLYLVDAVGWAQGAWVLASGTAGGAIAAWLDRRGR